MINEGSLFIWETYPYFMKFMFLNFHETCVLNEIVYYCLTRRGAGGTSSLKFPGFLDFGLEC